MNTAIEFAQNLYEAGQPIRDMAREVDAAFERAERALLDAHRLAFEFRAEVRKLWTQEEIESALGGKPHRGCPRSRIRIK